MARRIWRFLYSQNNDPYLQQTLWMAGLQGVNDGAPHPHQLQQTASCTSLALQGGPVLENLSIPPELWKDTCASWGIRGTVGNLEPNIQVLQNWSLTQEAQRNAVLGTPLMLNIRPVDLEKKLQWMVDEMGFSKDEVGHVIQEWPQFLATYPQEDIAPFINRFVKEGHSLLDIKKMILNYPPVLGARDSIVSTRRFFEAYFGFIQEEFLKMVVQCPQLLCIADTDVRPAVNRIMEYGFTRKEAVSMIRKVPETLVLSLNSKIKHKVAKFTSFGLDKKQTLLMLKEAPELLRLDFDVTVKPIITWLMQELGFTWTQALGTLTRWPWMFTFSLEQLQKSRDWFIRMGMDSKTIKQMCQNNARVLTVDPARLATMFAFARDVLGKEKSEIFRCPWYFSFSLEKRVLLRVAWLDNRGENYCKMSLKDIVTEPRRVFDKRFGSKQLKSFEEKFIKLTLEGKLSAIKNSFYP